MDAAIDYSYFNHFSLSADVGVVLIDKEGNQLFASERYKRSRQALDLLEELFHNEAQCKMSLLYGSYQALRFGGRYIFFCPRGLIHFVSPILCKGEMVAAAVAGPLLMTDYDEYIELDVALKHKSLNRELLYEAMKTIPLRTPETVQAMSEQLFLNASQVSDSSSEYLSEDHESQKLHAHISDYIAQVKRDAENGLYPLDKEDALLGAISKGDKHEAKSLLNDILGHIFFQSGANLDIVRSRVVELIVLLSRAAMKGGADPERIFGLNYTYLQEIDALSTMEDIIFWLNKIMTRFADYVFNFADAKHADLIYKAISYMKNNYMRKLTLEETAGYVYLSPPYLSKVFKEETGYNFNNYLNIIRIEQSKKLLQDPAIPIVDISNLVGYEDQSYFSKVFKRVEGISPGKYRKGTMR